MKVRTDIRGPLRITLCRVHLSRYLVGTRQENDLNFKQIHGNNSVENLKPCYKIYTEHITNVLLSSIYH